MRVVSGCRAMSQGSTTNTNDSTSSSNEREDSDDEVKQRILKSSVPFVKSHGWSQEAIGAEISGIKLMVLYKTKFKRGKSKKKTKHNAPKTKGHPPIHWAEAEGMPWIAHTLFQNGAVELVFYFYADCNKKLAEQLSEQVRQEREDSENKDGHPKIRPFIKGALETRLRMIMPYIDHWPQAMAKMALLPNIPSSFSHLLNLTDNIWFYAGDRSTDFNWYTKRLSLAGVYKATEVFMVADKSADFEETWEFLDRRIENMNDLGNMARNGQQKGTALSEGAKGLFIMAKNVVGANSRAK